MLEKVSNEYAKIIVFIISVYETLLIRQYFVISTNCVHFFNNNVHFANKQQTSRFALTVLSTRLNLVVKHQNMFTSVYRRFNYGQYQLLFPLIHAGRHMEARRPPNACPPAPIWKPTGCHLQDGTNNRFFIDKGLDSQPWKSSPQFSYSKSDSFNQTVLYGRGNTEGGLPTKQLTSCRSAMGKAADEQRWPHCRSENCGSHSARPRGASLQDK